MPQNNRKLPSSYKHCNSNSWLLWKPIRVTDFFLQFHFRVVASELSLVSGPRGRDKSEISELSLPSCRFQVVASKLSLVPVSHRRDKSEISELSLPSCRFQVVASELSLVPDPFAVIPGQAFVVRKYGVVKLFEFCSNVYKDFGFCRCLISCHCTFYFAK